MDIGLNIRGLTMQRSVVLAALLAICTAAYGQLGGFGQMNSGGPSLDTRVMTATDKLVAGEDGRIAIEVRLAEGWHVNAHKPLEEFLIATDLEFEGSEGLSVLGVAYPEPELFKFSFSEESMAVYEGTFYIGVLVHLEDTLALGKAVMRGKLRYQACNDKQCMAPKTLAIDIEFEVTGNPDEAALQHEEVFAAIDFGSIEGFEQPEEPQKQEDNVGAVQTQASDLDWRVLVEDFKLVGKDGGYLRKGPFLAFLDRAESGGPIEPDNYFSNKGVLFIVLSALIGGLLLNLTPCVLPMIPINIAIIGAGAQSGSRSRGFALGAMYGVGMAATYGVLGLVVVLGVTSTFGSLNATPWFNAVIALVFIVLSLAMFDIIAIDFSRFQSKLNLRGNTGGRFLIAFVMGIVAALLAGACVAPVIIAAIVFAQDQFSQGNVSALALPFLIGVGMALPWPFAGAGLSFIPKPGKWMNTVKHSFGVLILLFALYFGYQAYEIFDGRHLVEGKVGEDGWFTSLAEGLETAKTEDKKVIIDFWATWCKNCLTMDATTLKEEEVTARLEDYIKVKYQAEDPNNPETQEVMEFFGAVGLPTYVVLAPNPVPPKDS